MRPSTIWYTLKQGVKNIKRNWMFSLASIITMAACIFLFGIFFSIVNNVNNIAHKVEQEVPITVFFEEGTTNKQIKAIGKKIKARPEVEKIEYQSADEAWEEYKEQYFQGSEAADGFKDDNPLANSANYRVYMNDITKQSELVSYIQELKHVRKVNQSEEAAKTLGNINKLVSYISIAIIVLLLIISIFLISNTVATGIAVRKEEIAIMRLVGASNGFIRGPFITEGVLQAILGSLLSIGVLELLRNLMIPRLQESIGWMSFALPMQYYLVTYAALILVGVIIGLFGSAIAMRRYLRV